MDSDDESLVIDESASVTLVDIITENAEQVQHCTNETQRNERAHSMTHDRNVATPVESDSTTMDGMVSPVPEIFIVDEHDKFHNNHKKVDKDAIVAKENGPTSSKHRSDEKKRQRSAEKKKKRPSYYSNKPNMQGVRLTQKIFDEKLLNITCLKHHLYHINFIVRHNVLKTSTPPVYPAPPACDDLSLTQLMNWPGIKTIINLEHLTFVHEMMQNLERELVFGDDELHNINTDSNPLEVRFVQRISSSKCYPMASKDMFMTYLTSIMDAAPMYQVGPAKLPEINQTFRKSMEDVKNIPGSSIQCRAVHSRFLSKHRYYRIFDNTTPSDRSDVKVRLRETINPEVNFHIRKCSFYTDQIDTWQKPIQTYFKNLFTKSNSIQDTMRDRFKKCLCFKCEKCNEYFEGALWAVKIKDHIKQKHFVDKHWTCVKCFQKWNEFDLLEREWNHECTPNNNV